MVESWGCGTRRATDATTQDLSQQVLPHPPTVALQKRWEELLFLKVTHLNVELCVCRYDEILQ